MLRFFLLTRGINVDANIVENTSQTLHREQIIVVTSTVGLLSCVRFWIVNMVATDFYKLSFAA